MSRRPRDDAPGAVFHITARVNWRFWHFEPEENRLTFLRLLDQAARRFGVSLLCYVLMANHYHFVCRSPGAALFSTLTGRRTRCRHWLPYPIGHPKSSVLSQFMQAVMRCTSDAIQGRLGIVGRFWDGRFHSRRLHDATDLVTAMAYDHRNPVVKGLATQAEDYTWSSAGWWSGIADSHVRLANEGNLPFDLTRDELAERVWQYQTSRTFGTAMEDFLATGLRWNSDAGRAKLREILRAHGLA